VRIRRTISRFLYRLFPDGGSHSSGPTISGRLKRPTRESSRAGRSFSPIWSCSAWGLPCQWHCCHRGALLPHHFTLTGATVASHTEAVYFLWRFPW